MSADKTHTIKNCPDLINCKDHGRNGFLLEGDDVPKFLERIKANKVPGMIPSGTKVEKIVWEPGDVHGIGERGKVIGCVGVVEGERGYLVEWASQKNMLMIVREYKIQPEKK